MNLEEDSGLSVSCGNGKLRQWLIDQIDSRRYPGLVWENDEKNIFRIPWKHAGKQDYNREEDAALFKVRPSRFCADAVHLKHLTIAFWALHINYKKKIDLNTFRYVYLCFYFNLWKVTSKNVYTSVNALIHSSKSQLFDIFLVHWH